MTPPSRPPSAPCSRAGRASAAQRRKRDRAGDPAAGSGRRYSDRPAFAPGNCSLPFAIASVEHQNCSARGKTQHIAEIVALAALQCDRFPRCQGGIDKQPGAAKIELRHDRGSNPGRLLAQRARIYPIIGARRGPTPRCCQIPRVVKYLHESYIALSESLLSGRGQGPLDLAGGTILIIRRLLIPLTVAVAIAHAGQSLAQSAFPAPLPGRSAPVSDPAFPPVNGAAPSASVGAP